jgi:pyruvate,water dikinase
MMIFYFSETTVPQLSQVGGKAKALIETTQAGFPVPDGLVLSVEFFEPWLNDIKESEDFINMLTHTTKENCDKIKTIAKSMRFNEHQRKIFNKYINDLDGTMFAVRSSSPEEDLVGTSFAGMYETYLGQLKENLEEIVALAFSSCFDYRVILYKKQNNIVLEQTSIAIIIQKQIASEISGVGFSLNPLNNAYDEVVINASFGLGEAIVSGIVTPDMYTFDVVKHKIIEKKVNEKSVALWLNSDGGTTEKKNLNKNQQALSDEQIIELSGLIKKCEQHYGQPMDIEWAYESGDLYLLQSRPITTYLPFFEKLLTKPGEAKRFYIDLMMMTQGVSDPMSVMGMDVWRKLIYITKSGLLSTAIGGTAPVINGREYLSVTAYQKVLGKKTGRKALDTYDGNIKKIFDVIDLDAHAYNGKPEGTKGYMGRSWKKAFGMIPELMKALYSDSDKIIDDYLKQAKSFAKSLEQLDNNRAMNENIDEVMMNFEELMQSLAPILAGMLAQQSIKKIFKKDNIDAEITALNMDLNGNPTSEMGNLLFSMACSNEFKEIETRSDFIMKASNKNFSSSLQQQFDQFMSLYGSRGFKEIDVATTRSYEDFGMVYDKLDKINTEENQNLMVKAKREEAYNKLLKLAREKGKEKKFVKAASRLKATFGYREYPKYMLVNAFSVIHKICLELGKQWVFEGRLETYNQIFDLNIDEITRAQTDTNFNLMVAREKNLEGYRKVEHIKQWPLVIDSRGKIHRPVLEINDGDILGDAIAPGKVIGKAKILTSPYEKPLHPGEILITRATEPSWTPIFTNAAGIVMEIGGPLQHGGIIAREYGIPCVSGLIGIMDMLKDGDLIEVDGNKGVVRLIEQ